MRNQLTEYELAGLNGGYNLSDGHAYHDINESFPSFPQLLPNIWKESEATQINVAAKRFKTAFARLIGSETLALNPNFKISPTASNSIDLIAAYLAIKSPHVVLVSPTFDNLALLLRRRGCTLQLIEDSYFRRTSNAPMLFARLDSLNFDTLFLVNPNNPTGTTIPQEYMSQIAEYCADRQIALVLDTTFRLYAEKLYDERLILESSGCDYFVIEDTGKTWPTHDMKVSLVSYSANCLELFESIYDEVYLCHSRFSMLVFENLFEQTLSQGILKTIHGPVSWRHSHLMSKMNNSFTVPMTDRTTACLPLEWFQINSKTITDIEVVEYLAAEDIHVLPGSLFHWDKNSAPSMTAFRVSLSKATPGFYESVESLKTAITNFQSERNVENANVLS
jgi:aspartate/methionine/tyrosine aminotransferase